jgi:hypothetical protein
LLALTLAAFVRLAFPLAAETAARSAIAIRDLYRRLLVEIRF